MKYFNAAESYIHILLFNCIKNHWFESIIFFDIGWRPYERPYGFLTSLFLPYFIPKCTLWNYPALSSLASYNTCLNQSEQQANCKCVREQDLPAATKKDNG